MRLPAPGAVAIELTNRCNLRCKMCAFHSSESRSRLKQRSIGDMEFEFFEQLADQIAEFDRPPHIGLNYSGESLLYPRFSDVLELLRCRELSARSGFNTNGTLLKPSVSDMLLDCFEGSINISLDGFRESHERIRVGSRYNRVFENVSYLIERKRRLGLTRPRIVVNLVRVDQSGREIEEFVRYWGNRADSVRVYEHLTHDNRYVTSTRHLDAVLAGRRRACKQPFNYLAIFWDGSVTFCCNDISRRGMGVTENAHNRSIMEIWRGDQANRLRRLMIDGQVNGLPACGRCEVWAKSYAPGKAPSSEYTNRPRSVAASCRRKCA